MEMLTHPYSPEETDGSPRWIIAMDRLCVKQHAASHQTAGHGPGAVELWHGLYPLVWPHHGRHVLGLAAQRAARQSRTALVRMVPGCQQLGRPVCGPGRLRGLSRLRHPSRLDYLAGRKETRLAPRVVAHAAAAAPSHPARLDRAGSGRPRLVRALVVQEDRQGGLASILAHQGGLQVPPAGLRPVRVAQRPGGSDWATLARGWDGLCLALLAGGLYAAGLVGRRPYRTLVRTDRSRSRRLRRAMVWAALLVRAGLQLHQARRLAVATDPNDRSKPGGPSLAGDGGGYVVDDHAWQRYGAWPGRQRARSARSASTSGIERHAAATPPAAVPSGLAVAAGAIDRGAAAAGAAPAGA